MATQNLIQIKRSETTDTPASLANGELAWSGNGDVLFIGNFGSVLAVAGARNPGTLTANQAIVVDSDSKINNIIATDITLENQLTANGSTGSAGQVLYSAGASANAYWGDSAAGSLSGLDDTNITTPADGSLLFYDTGTSKWIDNAMSGDATIADTGVLTLASTTVVAATYGSASVVPVFTVDAKGRITGVTDTNIAIAATAITSGTLNSDRLPDLAVSDFGDAAIQTGTEVGATGGSIGDNDTSLLTAAAVINYVEGKGYGTVTSVDSGNGLTGGPITGSGTLAVGAGNGITVGADSVAVDGANGISVTADGVNVLANNGISVTTDGVLVDGANGISVTADGVNVLAGNNQIVSNTTGIWISSVTAAQISDDIALGTDTSGDYVATITAGNGIASLTGTGEGSAPTITVDGANGISVTAAGVNVLANNGIIANTTGVFVDGANGISVTTTGVNVLAGNNQIVSNTTGIWISSITAAQISDDITLGTDTTGNYVATIAGTTNEIEVTGSGSEDAAVTIGLPNDVTITNNLTVSNDLTVVGDLTVTGNVVSIDVAELKVTDSLVHFASNNNTNALDIGFVGHYSTDAGVTSLHNGIVWDASNGNFIAFDSLEQAGLDNGDVTIDTGDASFNLATIRAVISAPTATIDTLTLDTDLAVTHGGTGASSFTDNGIIYGNGTSALSVTAAGTQYQVLQAGSGGVPEWGSLDGGTF